MAVTTLVDLQDANLKRLINIIRQTEVITRQDLAEISGLSPAGVSKLVNTLISKGLVREDAMISRKRGRRAIGLKINKDCLYAIGVRVSRKYVKCGLFNISGELLESNTHSWDGAPPSETVKILKENISLLLGKNEQIRHRVVGIGISAPGPLMAHEGKIVLISNAVGWRNVPLARVVEETFSIPTFLEHDANVSVLAERWFGAGNNVKNMIYIVVERGVGAGVLINDRLYGGHLNIAGEIGHTTINMHGPRCECGNYGCLEMYTSSTALLNQAKEILGRKVSLDEVFALERDEHPEVSSLIAEWGRNLGVGVVTLINSFNPELIVLGDEMTKAGPVWLSSLKETVKQRTLPEIAEKTRIEVSTMPIEPAFVGSGTLVMNRVFENLSKVSSAEQ